MIFDKLISFANHLIKKPKIIKSAEKFKKELLNNNDAAMSRMAKAWEASYKRLETDFVAVSKQIDDATTEGKPFSSSWLFKQKHIVEMMRQVEAEAVMYGAYVADTVKFQQEMALSMGIAHSAEQVKDSSVIWNTINKNAFTNMVGFLADGSPLDYKFAQMAPAVSEGVKNTLSTAVMQGWNPRKTELEIRKAYGKSLVNSMVVCRTETMRAYNTATLENYRANSAVVKGWIWLSGNDVRTCMNCIAMDGTWHSLDEHFADHPAGRCTTIPSIEGSASENGWNSEVKFRGQSEDFQKAVLGKGKYELWKNGDISLSELPIKVNNEIWGDNYQIRSLKELKSEGYKATLKQNIEKVSADWTENSKNYGSTQTKEAISRYLNTGGTVYNPEKHLIDNAEVLANRHVVNSIYWKTQKDFVDNGINEVKLYRGVKHTYFDDNVAESWTIDQKKAVDYAGEKGIILAEDVPVSRIFMHHESGGWVNSRKGNESEYIVLAEAPK